jgi:hypothetical protein
LKTPVLTCLLKNRQFKSGIKAEDIPRFTVNGVILGNPLVVELREKYFLPVAL